MFKTLLASAALLSATSTSFIFEDRAPKQLVEEFAGYCMHDGSVVSMTDNQIVCELRMSREQKVNALFRHFRHRSYTEQVKHLASFTVIPSGEGSIGQTREWLEAKIGPQTRTAELRPDRKGSIRVVMDAMGGTPN